MYLVFPRMTGESQRRRIRFLLLRLCDVSRTLINSLVSGICTDALGLVLLQICKTNLGVEMLFSFLSFFLFCFCFVSSLFLMCLLYVVFLP